MGIIEKCDSMYILIYSCGNVDEWEGEC